MRKWVKLLSIGLLVVLVVAGGIGYYFHLRNSNSSPVEVAYAIPNDRRVPLLRTYRQQTIAKKSARQQQQIAQSVVQLNGEGPLLEFHGQAQTLKFRFTAHGQRVTPTGRPKLEVIAKVYDHRSQSVTKHYSLAKGAGGNYQVTLRDLFPQAKLTAKYNVVAIYQLALYYTIHHVSYVTFTAFITGH
ncbi:hypothetical protein [Lacticaseibacillus nasuensis]|uniref:hypothetical protein n=1 Tax=Lacticaseibacillus nasuensis TaxID=944671 RepID=UPI0006D1C4A8|nr:hypothetical protein [Lacticaseibacillus nasuensis]